jgi:glutathione synthase/RimK-type ligase-like ATP-grasp enzyme
VATPIRVVVSSADDVFPDTPRVQFVLADNFVGGSEPRALGPGRVINLCRDLGYLSAGYYVSLLADARGQDVEPSVDAIARLDDEQGVLGDLGDAGVPVADEVVGEVTTTRVILGTSENKRFRTLAHRVWALWRHPLLELSFIRENRAWRVVGVRRLGMADLAAEERHRLARVLAAGRKAVRAEHSEWSLAVLWDEADEHRPSEREMIDRLARVAARRRVHVKRLDLTELSRVAEHDALFLRAMTGPREPAMAFARRAEALGMPVIDDTRSILRCANKVWIHEVLTRSGVPVPPTVIADERTSYAALVAALGLPLVVKRPDGAFSAAVELVRDEGAWRAVVARWAAESPLFVVQKFTPTPFDWRVGVLDGKPLFAARYFMAKGHWQIAKTTARSLRYGRTEPVDLAEVDAEVLRVACAAATCAGAGLYGVDIKATADGPVVLEINENANLDVGYEDGAEGSAVYEALLDWFAARIE